MDSNKQEKTATNLLHVHSRLEEEGKKTVEAVMSSKKKNDA